jgi:hypothetical protein
MQGIYNYIREINHVARVYSVAAVLQIKFKVHVILLHILNVLSVELVLSEVYIVIVIIITNIYYKKHSC